MNSAIGFFDGFDGALVAIVYASLVVFSIVFQLVRQKLAKKGEDSIDFEDEQPQVQEVDNDNPYITKGGRKGSKKVKNINDSSMMSSQSKLLDGVRYSEVTGNQ